MNKLILPSYAKINLYLKITGKRKDGFHNLETIFEKIDLADKIIFSLSPAKKIKLSSNVPALATDSANLAFKSAELLQETYGVSKGVNIELIKRIPIAAGLGGGSSNAATVLCGLNKLWNLRLPLEKLVKLGRKIGSDVTFFLYNCSFAMGKGRGDRIKPLHLQQVKPLWKILVVPKIKVSTPQVYKHWDLSSKEHSLRLTIPKYDVNILISTLRNRDFAGLSRSLFNSLEEITLRLYPEVALVIESLRDLGVKAVLMSGSGPAVFGVVSSKKEAFSLGRKLEKRHRSHWRVFTTRTI